MQREKRLSKRERRALDPAQSSQQAAGHAQHIHCISCGRHLEPSEFQGPNPTAVSLQCDHKSTFPACRDCQVNARYLISEHDRTGKPVAVAEAWH
jgi:hypothetical protein